jgi:hypothetical protein
MPAGDGTGPAGQGSMTGRGMGYCAGYNAPGYANPAPGFGRGFGRGSGRGRGFGRGRFWYGPAPARYVPAQPQYVQPQYEYKKEDELADLKAEKEVVERDLKSINERIKDLLAEQEASRKA